MFIFYFKEFNASTIVIAYFIIVTCILNKFFKFTLKKLIIIVTISRK